MVIHPQGVCCGTSYFAPHVLRPSIAFMLRYQPHDPWKHIPSIWTEELAPEVNEEEDNIHHCQVVAKGTPPNAPHATFTCVQVACVNILVRLMFTSSP